MSSLAVVAGCLLLLGTDVAGAKAQPPPNPEKLWEAFPLDPRATTPAPRPGAAETPELTPAPVTPAREPAPTDRTLLIGGALAGLLVAFALVVLRARRRARWVTPQVPVATDDLIARAYVLAAECDMLLASQRDKGVAAVSEIADQDSPVAQATPTSAGTSGYAEIGERVAGVLSAAETAAEQIRADARAEAEQLIREAKGNAEQMRQAAVTYESDTRTAVDSYASDQRRQAEQQVSKQLADAEVQARATREAAEQMARHIEEEARLRGQALREESRAVEERLKKALAGLRRMTAQLEELVGAPAAAQTDGESLADALKPYGQRDEELQPLLEER